MNRNQILLGIVILFLSALSCSSQNNEVDTKKERALYDKFCASCHGVNLDRFANREWVFGGKLEDMFVTIKEGRPTVGMPGFAKAMTDEEIELLAAFVLKEMPHMSDSRDHEGEIVKSKHLSFRLVEVLKSDDIVWGMAFLPNGDMLATEKAGKLIQVGKNGNINIQAVPKVMNQGQGGLLDVAVHPNFIQNNLIYLSYAEDVGGGGNTTVIRAELRDNKLHNIQKLFHALPNSNSGLHFGNRIVFDNNGYIFFTVGERGTKSNAQDLNNHSGKVHRLLDDGRIPTDNPFVNQSGAQGSIWSYGHRNPQSLYFDKSTGILWEIEHGPKGGDELNIVQKGKNYGWPLVTFGIDYDGTIISKDTARPGLEPPVFYWKPSIAPCGMIVVTSNRYKNWKGNILVGSLSFKYLERVELTNNKVTGREKLMEDIGRLRNVVESPDGYIFISVERPGRVYRLVPVE